MPRIQDIYDCIDAAAPFDNALAFDNVGLLVGDPNAQVHRVLLALDITEAVAKEAIAMNAGLIISHHPVIFDPIKSLGPREVPYLLAAGGVGALCCHTNLDLSPVCGVNVALGARLGLRNVKGENLWEEAVLFSGELEEAQAPQALARFIAEKLEAPALRYIPGNRPVKKLFFCSGAGGDEVSHAAVRGADGFLTGEMKHHEAIEAARSGLSIFVAGHYETEKPFAGLLASYLKKRFPETAFLQSKAEENPFRSLS